MKVMLVTGGINSIWVKSFIENVLLPLKADIYIQRNPRERENLDFLDFYKENNVHFVFQYSFPKILNKIPKVSTFLGYVFRYISLKPYNQFDKIIVIFGNPFYIGFASKLASKQSKIFTWFIGSDLLRSNFINDIFVKLIVNYSKSSVVCVNKKIATEYKERFSNSQVDMITDFGNSQLDCIDKYIIQKTNYKVSFLKIESKYLTIAIGYNASNQQQHKKIIEAVIEAENFQKQNVYFVLPMTYHGSKKYIEEIRNLLIDNGLHYIILEDFLNSDGMAQLWLSTDIFIHAQTTDAFSASLLESIYSGCVVYNGSWNEYPELKEWGIRINQFSTFTELTNLLDGQLKRPVERNLDNKAIIKNYLSWDICRANWANLLDIKYKD